MSLLNNLLLILFLLTSVSFAEDEVDIIPDNSEQSVALQNDNFRKTARRLRDLENGISLTSGVTGILPLANGGTARALSDPNADRLLFWDDSSGYFEFLSIGSGLNITGTTITSGPGDYVAGDYLIAPPTSMVDFGGLITDYTKKIEIVLPRAGTLRIKFWLFYDAGGSSTTYGKIYRNGIAVGTERSIGTTMTEFSEDISGWSSGDLLQIYVKKTGDSSGTSSVGGLRLFENNPVREIVSSGYGNMELYSYPLIYSGVRSPITSFNSLGQIGDLFINSNGGASTTLYVKTGSTTWTAK